MDLPIYEMQIAEDDDTGVSKISMVDYPAIETNFIALENRKFLRLAISQDRQMLYGPALIPDQKIYRNDSEGEYYIWYSAQTIAKTIERFAENGYNTKINLQHDKNVKDCVVSESWLIEDPNMDKAKAINEEFGKLPAGTWMVGMKINNADFWEKEIKSGNARGFSIEGMFRPEGYKQQKSESKQSTDIQMENKEEKKAGFWDRMMLTWMNSIAKSFNKDKAPKDQIPVIMSGNQFVQVCTPDNMVAEYGEELILFFPKSGGAKIVSADGNTLIDVPDGNYFPEWGNPIMIAGGIGLSSPVDTVEPAQAQSDAPKEDEVKQEDAPTDTPAEETKQETTFTLEDGRALMVDEETGEVSEVGADGSLVPLEDGEYTAVDGTILVVANGVIIETINKEDSMGLQDQIKQLADGQAELTKQMSAFMESQVKFNESVATTLQTAKPVEQSQAQPSDNQKPQRQQVPSKFDYAKDADDMRARVEMGRQSAPQETELQRVARLNEKMSNYHSNKK